MQISNVNIAPQATQKINPQPSTESNSGRLENKGNNQQNPSALANERNRHLERLSADEHAIAAVEQDFNTRSKTSAHSNSTQFSSSAAGYDLPSSRNQGAVAAYQSVDNLAKRDSVQQVFGVDLFA